MCKHYVYIHLSLCMNIFCAHSMWLLCTLEDIHQVSSSLWNQPFHEYVQIIKRYHTRHPLHIRSSEQLHIILKHVQKWSGESKFMSNAWLKTCKRRNPWYNSPNFMYNYTLSILNKSHISEREDNNSLTFD